MTTFAALAAADKMPVRQLLDLASQNPQPAELRDAISATLAEADIKKGTAVLGEGPDFLWAFNSASEPSLVIDDGAATLPMTKVPETTIWFARGQMLSGRSHKFHYLVNGVITGGRNDVAAFPPEAYAHPGVPQGTLSEKLIHTSAVYEGMKSEYWVYVPAQYDPNAPAALMVWQDGQGHIDRDGPSHTLNVVDSLIHNKKIPVMIQVFIAPGKVGDRSLRSVEYDTVSDRYVQYLRELLADVETKYKIRKDGYSRGITGLSSGGIAAFNAAWFTPDRFSRVLSRIGSFTSIQWHEGVIDGGNVYPFMIRKEPKRNIRVWLSDGSEDLENEHGSWPLQNLQMANSLKMRGYDFHLNFGNGTHNGAWGNTEAPAALAWLWRGYDAAKTEENFEMDPSEKDKPYFRVKSLNRE